MQGCCGSHLFSETVESTVLLLWRHKLAQSPGTLVFPPWGQCLFTGSQPASLPQLKHFIGGWVWFLITALQERRNKKSKKTV